LGNAQHNTPKPERWEAMGHKRQRQEVVIKWFAAGLIISQLVPGVPHRPEIILGAFGLIGLPKAIRAQDIINTITKQDEVPK
jgi:hypothetical protein